MIKYISLIFLLGSPVWVFAQPANDDCNSATPISTIQNWCSQPQQFTNAGATASGFGPPTCFTNANDDVWFSFVPIATDVTITVVGNDGNGNGTLNNPEVALYAGSCAGTINEQECSSANQNVVEIYKGGLAIGQTYFIRVDGDGNNQGTFQLCINNYNAPANPGSDCPTSSVLCNKESFTVQSVIGAGSDPDEASGSCLGSLFGNSESNSTWFSWVAANNGSLTFTLTPNNPEDDLDFAIYRLPNGIDNCSGKELTHCMASGDFDFPSPCMGPTGLTSAEIDLDEDPGCDPGDNNFLAPLQMQAGTAYALLVNNFTSSGNGFSIEFGGSGEIQGPEADFTLDQIPACIGNSVTITDNSSFPGNIGNITNWTWNFGANASPSTATGEGPHQVMYSELGTQAITLTVETDLGCIVTEVQNIEVDPCCHLFPMEVDFQTTDLACYDANTGAIDLEVSGAYPPFTYNWSNNAATQDVNNLGVGIYEVTITDNYECDTIIPIEIQSPPEILIDWTITKPTCNGGMDGAIFLNVSGGIPPYEYDWGSGFNAINNIQNIPIGFYDVTIRDGNGCLQMRTIEVRELELELDSTLIFMTPPTCYGDCDGAINLTIANGLPPYEFDWGGGFVLGNNTATGLCDTIITVVARDANFCYGTFTIDVAQPDSVDFDLIYENVSCFSAGDGWAAVIPYGGVGNYSYQWSGLTDTDSLVQNLVPGNYNVVVLDGNGCTHTEDFIITEPPELSIDNIDILDVVCFGDATGEVSFEGLGGTPPYEYNIDFGEYQPEGFFTDLPSGDYTIGVRDENNCIEEVLITITQPTELIVQAEPDKEVDLGYSTVLNAIANEPVSFSWSPPESLTCSTCPTTSALPVNTTTFIVEVTNNVGCKDTDTITVNVNKLRPVFIPNVFTPNGDGQNDFLSIFSNPAARRIKYLRIFDRWGEMVYEGKDMLLNQESFGWDGTYKSRELNPGVFVYVAEVEFIDDYVELYSGDVTLVR